MLTLVLQIPHNPGPPTISIFDEFIDVDIIATLIEFLFTNEAFLTVVSATVNVLFNPFTSKRYSHILQRSSFSLAIVLRHRGR